MWNNAKSGNASIQIWLSKQHLNMKEMPKTDIIVEKKETFKRIKIRDEEVFSLYKKGRIQAIFD